MSKPLISLDIETSSLTAWTGEIISLGLVWEDEDGQQELFVKGEPEIKKVLLRLEAAQSPLLVYNQSFEQAWFTYKFPEINLNYTCDVMRLVQLAGASFDSGAMKVDVDGFGLKPAVVRILGITESWTEEIYDHLSKQFGVPKSKAAAYLGQAPDSLLRPYNLADCIYTLKLYKFLTDYFTQVKYDWKPDQKLYQSVVKELVSAQVIGFEVNRPELVKYVSQITNETAELDNNFLTTYATEINEVRERLRAKEQAKFKKKIVTEAPEFNTGSRQHLEMLFCDVLGIEPTFLSPTGNPSFKSAHMGTYGEPGAMLALRGKRQIIQKQVEAVLRATAHDGLIHVQLKAVGTITGRFAGASGVNVQGWSRSDKPFMENITARPNHLLIEQDFLSGEPTIIAAYTQDPVYMYHTFTGNGKAPYYDDSGLLWIDDAYIAFMSVSGQGSKELKQLFHTELFDGLTFAEQWLKDPEVVKSHLVIKKWRKINKMLALALGYGLGAKKLVKQVKEQFGITVSESEARKVVKSYWGMYSKVKEFAEKCSYRVQQSGSIVNQFGFRLTPEPQKAFNAVIQSTLSGIVNWRLTLLREACPWFQFYTIIHDSIVMEIPEDRLKEFNEISDKVDKEINRQLGWVVDVRTGRNAGRNFYEIK